MSEKIKLLIADHNHLVHKKIDSILKSYSDYEYKFVKDYDTLVLNLKEHRPDIIILDYDLYGARSTDVCKALKKNFKTKFMPVIFMINDADQMKILEAVNSGAAGIFIKPAVPDVLNQKLNEASHLINSMLTIIEFQSAVSETAIANFELLSKETIQNTNSHLIIDFVNCSNINSDIISNITKLNFMFKNRKHIFSLLCNNSGICSEFEKFGLLKTVGLFKDKNDLLENVYLGKYTEKNLKI